VGVVDEWAGVDGRMSAAGLWVGRSAEGGWTTLCARLVRQSWWSVSYDFARDRDTLTCVRACMRAKCRVSLWRMLQVVSEAKRQDMADLEKKVMKLRNSLMDQGQVGCALCSGLVRPVRSRSSGLLAGGVFAEEAVAIAARAALGRPSGFWG
jgi:hypothetical protein